MKPTFVLPSKDNFDAILAMSRSIKRGTDIPFDLNHDIAKYLGVPLDNYTSTMDGALKLRDIIYAGYDYVNLDMREYDDERGLVFLMKIENQYGESSGNPNTELGGHNCSCHGEMIEYTEKLFGRVEAVPIDANRAHWQSRWDILA